jgi:hypothetical protein
MARILYEVDMVDQQYSPVCWLACAAMLLQYHRRLTPTAAMLGLRGPDFRTPGYTVPEEVSDGPAKEAWLRRLGFTVTTSRNLRDPRPRAMAASPSFDAGVAPPAGLHEELLYWLLANRGPFILNHHCGAFWYGPGRPLPKKGAHSVVVTGIDTGRHDVYFNNPWGDRNVATTAASILGAIRRYEAAGGMSIAYL